MARWVLWGVAAAHVAQAVHLRRRAAAVRPLPDPGPGRDPGTDDAREVIDLADELVVLSAAGVEVDRATRAAVAAELRAGGVEAVDLVPAGLPAERALALLQRVDQDRLRDDPLYSPAGAHEAIALHPDLAARMGVSGGGPLDRRSMVRRTIDVQRHAAGKVVLRAAPRLRTMHAGASDRWQEMEELAGGLRPFVNMAPMVVGGETVWLLALATGVVVAPVAGLAALAAWSAQPALALGRPRPGSDTAAGLRPDGLLAASLLRWPRAWSSNARTVAAGFRSAATVQAERRRREIATPPPLDELFEPRRDTCPWCDAADLVGRVDVPDFFQHKPGTFHIDECLACGHLFQNPRLSLQGLDYYYDQFYDGAAEEAAELTFAQTTGAYATRVESVARFVEPRSWLDVGTGHGHFCAVIRQRWPEAVVDGLDMSDSIEVAARRGWVDTGYRGLLPDMAGGMPRTYDVVSMAHYLEHTRDPRAELTAAAKVLSPGGHLVIDVPDPEAPWARWLGRWWIPWFQPQHQHLLPCRNLIAALEEAGFEIVSVERGTASMPAELCSAVFFAVQALSRSPHMPWLPAPSLTDRARRSAVLLASLPLFGVARLVEAVRDARLGPDDVGNAYRLVARRR